MWVFFTTQHPKIIGIMPCTLKAQGVCSVTNEERAIEQEAAFDSYDWHAP